MSTLTFRNSQGTLVDIPTVAATQVKNEFGAILDKATRAGAVAITVTIRPRPCWCPTRSSNRWCKHGPVLSITWAPNSTIFSTACRAQKPKKAWTPRLMPRRRSLDAPRSKLLASAAVSSHGQRRPRITQK